MKKILLFILSFFYISNCLAQEIIEKKNHLTNKVIERFHVLKDSEQIKHGLYQALYKRKTAVASGNYIKGKKTGIWYFYDPNGKVLQIYNYTKDSVRYEAREDTASDLRYLIDKIIGDTDRVTKPIKAGGRYFGYLPYLALFKTPFTMYEFGSSSFVAIVELLISPMGRLASYKVRVVAGLFNYDQTTTFDVKLLKEEDRQFIPATYNGEPILSRVIIRCRLNNDGGLEFY